MIYLRSQFHQNNRTFADAFACVAQNAGVLPFIQRRVRIRPGQGWQVSRDGLWLLTSSWVPSYLHKDWVPLPGHPGSLLGNIPFKTIILIHLLRVISVVLLLSAPALLWFLPPLWLLTAALLSSPPQPHHYTGISVCVHICSCGFPRERIQSVVFNGDQNDRKWR